MVKSPTNLVIHAFYEECLKKLHYELSFNVLTSFLILTQLLLEA